MSVFGLYWKSPEVKGDPDVNPNNIKGIASETIELLQQFADTMHGQYPGYYNVELKLISGPHPAQPGIGVNLPNGDFIPLKQ